MHKTINLKELFPNWEQMKPDECASISISGVERPNLFLGLPQNAKSIISLTLMKDGNDTYVFSMSDGKNGMEYILDNTLTKQIVLDNNGEKVTAENDHENESAEDAYDYFFR